VNEGQFIVIRDLLTRIADSLERMEANGAPTITRNADLKAVKAHQLPTRQGEPPTPPTMKPVRSNKPA